MVHILFLLHVLKNKWMQRLHDKVNGNWQKLTTMVYEINKSRDLKREKEITFEKKFLNP